MYTKILVPLDGSERGERILPHVENLALQYRSTIILFQAVEPITEVSHADIYVPHKEKFDAHLKKARSYLDQVKGRLADKGIDVRTLAISGPVVNSICETAVAEQVDLIALASHGRTGAARVFYGSVAAGVLHRVDRPLLIIRSRKS